MGGWVDGWVVLCRAVACYALPQFAVAPQIEPPLLLTLSLLSGTATRSGRMRYGVRSSMCWKHLPSPSLPCSRQRCGISRYSEVLGGGRGHVSDVCDDTHSPAPLLQTTSDPAQLKMLLTAVELMCEIFYSLNYQVCSRSAQCRPFVAPRLTFLPSAASSIRTWPPSSRTTCKSGWTVLRSCSPCRRTRPSPTTLVFAVLRPFALPHSCI